MDNNQQQFLELVRAGLFPGKSARILVHGTAVDWDSIYRLSEEQSVMGLAAAGIDTLPLSERPPKEATLQFVGCTLQLEQRNKAMNDFVAQIITLLRKNDVYTLLVKGQGVAQCYERPLWRSCGDVDLFLSDSSYEKAKEILIPLATDVEKEFQLLKHIGMTLSGFVVELHGTLRIRLTRRIDCELDKIQKECFYAGEVRSWLNGNTQVFLPGADQDALFVFTHILQHLFIEGIGLRQICDWCRLLWTYRDNIDHKRLENHLRAMGLMTEWKAFGSLAVEWLGMPAEAMPFYDSSFKGKGLRLLSFVLETGNFGQNRDKKGGILKTFGRRTIDAFKMMRIFPIDAWKMYFGMIWTGLIIKAELV